MTAWPRGIARTRLHTRLCIRVVLNRIYAIYEEVVQRRTQHFYGEQMRLLYNVGGLWRDRCLAMTEGDTRNGQ